jgi:hypothetical protein
MRPPSGTALDFVVQRGEPFAPETVEHRQQVRHPIGARPIQATIAIRAHAYEVRLSQHPEMLRRRRPRQATANREVARSLFAIGDELKHPPAMRMSERP